MMSSVQNISKIFIPSNTTTHTTPKNGSPSSEVSTPDLWSDSAKQEWEVKKLKKEIKNLKMENSQLKKKIELLEKEIQQLNSHLDNQQKDDS